MPVCPKKNVQMGENGIEEYLVTRDNLRVVVSLVDLRHEPTQDDIQMYEFLKYYEIPVIVVATKADKIPRGKWNKHESIIKKKLNFDKNDHFIVFHLSHVTVMMKHGIRFWQNCKKSSEKSEFFSCDSL